VPIRLEEVFAPLFKKTREKSPYFLLAVDFGYTLLAGIGLFGYLGWLADGRFGTAPLFLLVGIGTGLAVGFNSLFRRLNLLERKRRLDQAKDDPEDPMPRP
jgi:F0F1-type ATP synthase assembly protein I